MQRTERQPGDLAPRCRAAGVRWSRVLFRIGRAVFNDDLWGVSGGVAFYAWFAVVFVLVLVVSLYGLVASPDAVRRQIEAVSGLVPETATQFLAEQMQAIAAASAFKAGAGLVGALLASLWSGRAATATLITALNITYRVQETRPFLRLQAVTFLLTGGAALFGIVAFLLVAPLAVMAGDTPAGSAIKAGILVGRWLLLAGLMTLALATLYRFAPCRPVYSWRWISGGAVAATILWLLASAGLSYYVARVSAQYSNFGALGAMLVFQTWLYITAFAVLLGAKLNAEAEFDSNDAEVGGGDGHRA